MIEQRAVFILSRLELLHKSGKQLDMKTIDLRHLVDKVGMTAVMNQRMVRVGNADLGIRPYAVRAG